MWKEDAVIEPVLSGAAQKVSDGEVRKIVLSYLVHNCFKETAETFIACSGMKRTADCSVDIDKRKRVFLFCPHQPECTWMFQYLLEHMSWCFFFLIAVGRRNWNVCFPIVNAAIYNHVLEGNVLKAVELTNQLAVDLLPTNKDVHFELLTLHFVELVRAKDWYGTSFVSISSLQYVQKLFCVDFFTRMWRGFPKEKLDW